MEAFLNAFYKNFIKKRKSRLKTSFNWYYNNHSVYILLKMESSAVFVLYK